MYSFEKKIVVGKVYIWIYLSPSKSVKVFFNDNQAFFYPLANEVAKGYSNATVCPSFRPSVLP